MEQLITLLKEKETELLNYVANTNRNIILLYLGSEEQRVPKPQQNGWQSKTSYFDYYNMAVDEIQTIQKIQYGSYAAIGVTYIGEKMYYFFAVRRRYHWMTPEMQNADHVYFNDPIKLFEKVEEMLEYTSINAWWSIKAFGAAELRDYIKFGLKALDKVPTKAPIIKGEVTNNELHINSLHTLATNMVG